MELSNNYTENKFVLKSEESGKTEKWDKDKTMQDSSRVPNMTEMPLENERSQKECEIKEAMVNWTTWHWTNK